MVINHNISALNTYNKLNANESAAAASLEKLSSGLRINKAADDAAGLAISQKMQAQINSLDQASSNAQDGISLIQTAEGGMNQIQTILQRMNDLATESANGTQDNDNGTDRTALNTEFQSLAEEIDRIASSTQFNGKNLIDGSLAVTVTASSMTNVTVDGTTLKAAATGMVYTASGAATLDTGTGAFSLTLTGGDLDAAGTAFTATVDSSAFDSTGKFLATTTVTAADADGNTVTLTFAKNATAGGVADKSTFTATDHSLVLQVGANNTDNDKENVTIGDMRIKDGNDATMTSLASASILTQTGAQAALDTVKAAIDEVSAQRANLGAYQNRLNYTISNLSTESQITDVDMAKEMTEYTKNNILTQAANAMLAQANQLPQSVLSLLKS